MSDKINVGTPFGEAIVRILENITNDYKNKFAVFSVQAFNSGYGLHINVRMASDSTKNIILEKGHYHCTWTRQFYPTAVCMDINTLFEELEKGVKPSPRRNFEEIVKELAENPCIKADFHEVEIWTSDDDAPAVFATEANEEEGWEPIIIHRSGKIELNTDLTPAQLAAIFAACTEIAANYAAEHGKGEAR